MAFALTERSRRCIEDRRCREAIGFKSCRNNRPALSLIEGLAELVAGLCQVTWQQGLPFRTAK